MYMASPARGNTPQHKQIPDGPIKVFSAIIEESKADEWNKRIKALIELVKDIPDGSAYSAQGSTWFNTPAMLRHLALPLSELLKDARSTVVKRTCEHLAKLSTDVSRPRYLFKDIMPTILAVHAQTVHVIRLGAENDHGEYPRGSLQNDHAPLDGTSETR
jgi:hypothetical protein